MGRCGLPSSICWSSACYFVLNYRAHPWMVRGSPTPAPWRCPGSPSKGGSGTDHPSRPLPRPPPTEPAADFPPVLGVGSLLLGSHSTQVGFHDRVSPCAGASGREGGRAASCPRMQGSPVAPWGGPSGNRVRGWQAALGVSCLVLSCWQDDLLSLTGTRRGETVKSPCLPCLCPRAGVLGRRRVVMEPLHCSGEGWAQVHLSEG